MKYFGEEIPLSSIVYFSKIYFVPDLKCVFALCICGLLYCYAEDLPTVEFDRQVKFIITTAQTKEDKARIYIFLQTQKNPTSHIEQTHAPDAGASLLPILWNCESFG
jgi:hypothetical protein